MRLAVISDIHGNLEAFREVLNDIDKSGADAIVCLGDNVGYGPDPAEVLELIRQMGIPSVMGNHELGLTDPEYLDWFNEMAKRALVLTRDCLSEDAVGYCGQLPSRLVVDDCLCVHGCPPDSCLTYIFEPDRKELARLFEEMEQDVCFVGHTHMLEVILYGDGRVQRSPIGERTFELPAGSKCIINVGSVGQPRDKYGREAKYVLYDSATRGLDVRFVPYDVSVTANKILTLGWPEHLAARLW